MYKKWNDLDLNGKTVLLRCDLNLPLHEGQFLDMTRLDYILPTLDALWGAGAAKIVLLSHFGRPQKGRDPLLSLEPVSAELKKCIKETVAFYPDCVGENAQKFIQNQPEKTLILLENIRFYPEEEKNDSHFAQQLSQLGDVFINEAFSASHRAHASIVGLNALLPSGMGPQMLNELEALQNLFASDKTTSGNQNEHQLMAIVGGSKVSTKIAVLKNLVQHVNVLVLGGGMANTFMKFSGQAVGASLVEDEAQDVVLDILELAKIHGCRLELPIDGIVATSFTAPSRSLDDLTDIKPDEKILDVGPKTIAHYISLLQQASHVLWNGPLGVVEIEHLAQGTLALGRESADLTQAGNITSVAGGGDTVAVLNKLKRLHDFTHVSTAGGAFLEWISGDLLPGIEALKRH